MGGLKEKNRRKVATKSCSLKLLAYYLKKAMQPIENYRVCVFPLHIKHSTQGNE